MAYRVYNPDGISKTLAAVGGGAGAKTGLYAVKVLKPYGSTGGVCGFKIAENKTGIASTLTQDRTEKRRNVLCGENVHNQTQALLCCFWRRP